ncbi:nucleotide disphospho-sugar-binding domain-containing protein [Amycolatopsis sp. lyj-112]|uniref:nucleotide disphospho-sugar-binding domain-containing protein n=1 Tax=Amycolatopsis sp. lyj-112 TaxID=2789288 RepID=UPI003978CAE9
MRVLFVTCPGKTHLYAFTPLAWALQTAGHEVRVASQIDPESFTTSDFIATGLTGVELGDKLDLSALFADALPELPPTTPQRQAQDQYIEDNDPVSELTGLADWHFGTFNSASVIEGAVRLARAWRPHLVIWDGMTMAFAGPIAARVAGAAHARFTFGTDVLSQLRDAAGDQDPVREAILPILARYGLEYAEDTLDGQWSINAMPPWTWQPPGRRYQWLRPIPYNGPATVPDWVLDEPVRRRVCITLGLSHRELNAGAATATLLDGVADLDAEVVVTLSREQLDALPRLPGNVRPVEFVPLTALLPTCSAIVHHGGYGTFISAIEHGVPQLVVPGKFGNDKFWGPTAEADALESHGAGLYVSESGHVTADVLREKLQQVLKEPDFARNAARLRDLTDELPTPNEIVPALERLTARHSATKAS